jgi:outer membrane protein assembly factor BamE (lipoprotein component of BamABCDE complex)
MKNFLRVSATASLLAITLLGATLSGCAIVNSNNSHVTGKRISAEQLALVKPGTTKDTVVDLLGLPTSRTDLGNGLDVWQWKFTQTSNHSTGLIFVFISDSSSSVEQTTSVEFKDGGVTRTWTSDNTAKADDNKTPDKN